MNQSALFFEREKSGDAFSDFRSRTVPDLTREILLYYQDPSIVIKGAIDLANSNEIAKAAEFLIHLLFLADESSKIKNPRNPVTSQAIETIANMTAICHFSICTITRNKILPERPKPIIDRMNSNLIQVAKSSSMPRIIQLTQSGAIKYFEYIQQHDERFVDLDFWGQFYLSDILDRSKLGD